LTVDRFSGKLRNGYSADRVAAVKPFNLMTNIEQTAFKLFEENKVRRLTI